ncbi:hypothetical protein QZH41_006207 [Actinostola sp. cb2023]|nr:hypothetical protein QZH41_006207 [Actinostola sp. cb2023]
MFETWNLSSNSSNATHEAWYSIDNKVPKTLAYCLLFFISIVGNSFILRTIYKDSRLKTTTNFLMANMAVSDLLTTTCFVPKIVADINYDNRWLIDGDVSLALCKLVNFLADVSFHVSVYSCVFIAIDRYYAVAHPMKRGFSRSRLKYIILGIWMFATLIASPYLYYFRLKEFIDIAFCGTFGVNISYIHIYILIILIIVMPLTIVTIVYVLIVYKLRHNKVPGQQTDSIRRRIDQQNRKVLNMAVVIVALSSLSLGCLAIFAILANENVLKNSKSVYYDLGFSFIFIFRFNVCYNFFIYLIFNDIYRENFKTMISKCRCCTCSVNINNGETDQELEAI